MISLEMVENSILELENHDTTFANCEKLSWLYIVKDHINQYQQVEKTINADGQSEFMQAVAGRNQAEVFKVLDDFMTDISLAHPQMYRALINKIEKI